MAPYTPPFDGWALFGLGVGLAGSVLVVGLAALTVYGLWLALLGWAGGVRARPF
jgi:hypothetical protein